MNDRGRIDLLLDAWDIERDRVIVLELECRDLMMLLHQENERGLCLRCAEKFPCAELKAYCP